MLQYTTLTRDQIVTAFPEGQEIIKRNLLSLRKEIKSLEDSLTKMYLDAQASEDLKMFVTNYTNIFFLEDLHRSHSKLKRMLAMYTKKEGDLDVQSAKHIPIQDLHEFDKVKKSSTRISCSCPFHQDKTPSFVIYLKSNSYYCFSCQSTGDSIAFVMKISQLNFVQAVKFLNTLR